MKEAQADISTIQVSHVIEIDKGNKKVHFLSLDNSQEGAPFSKKYGNDSLMLNCRKYWNNDV